MRGRRRLASASVPAPVRPGGHSRCACGASGRRRLCHRNLRGRCGRRHDRSSPTRRQARLRPCLRACAPVSPVHRRARGVPDGSDGAGACAESGANPSSSVCDGHRRSERVSRRDRSRLGSVQRTASRAHESRAAANAGRAGAPRARHLRLRRAAHASEGPRRRDRGDRPGARGETRRRRRRA